VAKIIDFANFKYQQKKKDQSGKKGGSELKEIRLTPFIAENDLNNRVKKARDFLAEGDRVKINVKFIGRQITRKEFGQEVIDRVAEKLGDISTIDQPAKMQGRIMSMTLKPTKKPKPQPKPDTN
jgi:translation initiation factor IF-3